MSSTESKRFAVKVQRLFERKLMTAAKNLRDAGREPFPRSGDPALSTYFLRRERTAMTRADFELPALDSPEALRSALEAFWKARSAPELVELAPDLADLAGEARGDEQRSDDVSPFMYEMF